MIIIRKLRTFLYKPSVVFEKTWHLFEPLVSDKFFIRILFRIKVGYWPNLNNPRSFNEKLQWLKLNYKRPEYTKMVDKVTAKDYVASIIGDNYIIPTISVWDSVNDITWDKLPNQFVIKASHDSGGVVVCKDKTKLDISKAKETLSGAGKKDYTRYNKEYPYHKVPHRFIAEQYMEDPATSELRDYKFFCFDGEVKALFIASDRQNPKEETKFDFFDADFNHLPFRNGHPNAKIPPKKPVCFNEMKSIAAKLSKGIPEVRVDLYEVDGRVYFGEMTFFHWSGMTPFEPKEWDYKFGSWINLPNQGNTQQNF